MTELPPDVSVVIAVYKNVENLGSTLNSMFAQLDVNFEVILIDDGNSPSEKSLLNSLVSSRPNIRVIVNEKNLGLTRSLKKGCEAATADFIARIDNLDLMVPDSRLRTQFHALKEDASLGIVAGSAEYVDLTTGDRYQTELETRRLVKGDHYNSIKPHFCHVTVMFRKDAYLRAGGYNPAIQVGQETALWPRILKIADGLILPEIFAIATMQDDSISVARNRSQIIGKIKTVIQVAKSDNKRLRGLMTLMRHVPLEILKLAIPDRQRMRLRYRKNKKYVGRLPKNVRSSFEALEEFYRNQ